MKKFEELKVNMNLSIGYSGASRSDNVMLSECIDKETWESMSEAERVKFIDDYVLDWSNDLIDVSGWIE